MTRSVGFTEGIRALKNFQGRGTFKAEICQVKSQTLEDLKEMVSNFEDFLDQAEVRRAVRDARPRPELCLKMRGGHF